jgi:hypothetical protein
MAKFCKSKKARMPHHDNGGIMAIEAYLQIEGIKGESTDDKHKDWIEVSHVNWAFTLTALSHHRTYGSAYGGSFTKLEAPMFA